MAKAQKLYIQTHGCQMNEYDSEKMLDVLRATGDVSLTTQADEADILLLNTCSIREKAQEKVFSALGRWRELKKKRPDLIIGVGGCVASQEGAEITKRAPYVDIVFGPQTLHRLPALIEANRTSQKSVVDISFPEIEKFDHLPKPQADGPSAFVSIMEGCSKYCSYCVVPYTRGEELSRPFESVLREIMQLAAQDVKEVNLLGQNVNDYRSETPSGEAVDLALLIYYIAEIKGIERIRFTTSHPLAFSNNLIEAYRDIPKLCNHLHLPVQSGSDKILALMKRGYTALEYKSKMRKLRNVRPDISLSSDFIIGFPGETDADFQATMNLIEDIHFDTSFSFIYSKRPGTPAANLADDTPMAVKKERLQILQSTLRQQAAEISASMLDSIQPLLITGVSKKNPDELMGRTENNRVVNFVGSPNLIGQIIPAHITEVRPNSLRGVLHQVETNEAL